MRIFYKFIAKITKIVVLLLISELGFANMASPILEGTMTTSAFSSDNIDIKSETIYIIIDENYKTAKFIVEYTIDSDQDGKQIPLLFYARDYKGNFSVWLDNKKINISVWLDNRKINIGTVPEKYIYIHNTPFKNFSNATKNNPKSHNVTIYWHKNYASVYPINDLKYFEADISKGTHVVRVEYTAKVWTDLSFGWTKKYSFRYSLTPAQFWKSFGTLKIIVEQKGKIRQITTNLGESNEGEIQAKNTWTFNKLPDKYFEISYQEKPNKLASILILITPLNLSIITMFVLFAIHLFIVIKCRKKYRNKKYSVAVILGTIIATFLSFFSYISFHLLIYSLIGKEASGYQGYTFMIFLLYPIVLPIYWLIMWQIDRYIKRKLNKY